MTRKQALLEAIDIVHKSDKSEPYKKEIIVALKLCVDELPFASWSENAIFDACDQFIIDNGRNIHVNDFGYKGLPSHSVIKNRFCMTAKEFRDKYYSFKTDVCTHSIYCNKSSLDWKRLFIDEYNRIKPTGQADYNKRRSRELPSWITVAKMLGHKNWRALIQECELDKYGKGRQKKNLIIRSSSQSEKNLKNAGSYIYVPKSN